MSSQAPPVGPLPRGNPPTILSTANDDIAKTPFYVLNWVFFSLCTIAFLVRIYIRFTCFRRLFFEDYVILLALLVYNAEAIVIQIFLGDAYELEALSQGDTSKASDPGFIHNVKSAFVAVGVSINLTVIGVLLVKINFMLFFRRLGMHLQWFIYLWWGILLFTIGGAAAQIGTLDFTCIFASSEGTFGPACSRTSARKLVFVDSTFSAVVDAVSDILIIGFPVAILWKSRIPPKKKWALTLIFGLVFVTIGITIIRGSIFHSVYSSDGDSKIQSITFTWFWFYTEFTVAYIIACMVSFRALFVHRDNASWLEQRRRDAAWHGKSPPRKVRGWKESVLDTCRTLEGWSGSEVETSAMHKYGLPDPPAGLMTVDFNDDSNWGRGLSEMESGGIHTKDPVHVESTGSNQSLLQPAETYKRG